MLSSYRQFREQRNRKRRTDTRWPASWKFTMGPINILLMHLIDGWKHFKISSLLNTNLRSVARRGPGKLAITLQSEPSLMKDGRIRFRNSSRKDLVVVLMTASVSFTLNRAMRNLNRLRANLLNSISTCSELSEALY